MRRLAFLVLTLVALTAAPLTAAAGAPSGLATEVAPNRSVSYSYWTIEGATVRVRFVLPTGEARDLAAPGAPPPTIAAVASAVGSGLGVSAGGQDCEAIDQGEGVGTVYTMALTPGVYRFELIFRCPRAYGIVLHDHLLFARAPGHVDYALIQRGGASALRSFTSDKQEATAPPGPLVDQGAGFFAWRTLTGKLREIQSLCVAAGLLLLCRRWRDLAFPAGGLGVGYGVSLGLTVSGLAARAPLTELGVDAVVMLLGAGALYVQTIGAKPDGGRWPAIGLFGLFGLLGVAATIAAALVFPKAGLTVAGLAIFGCALLTATGAGFSSAWVSAVLAALFSLLDGARLPGDLAPLHLTPLRLAPIIAASDLGAMAAIFAMAVLAMAALWVAARRAAFARPVAEDMAGAGVLGFGVFWFVSHLYS